MALSYSFNARVLFMQHHCLFTLSRLDLASRRWSFPLLVRGAAARGKSEGRGTSGAGTIRTSAVARVVIDDVDSPVSTRQRIRSRQ